jgi:hypothetical protein
MFKHGLNFFVGEIGMLHGMILSKQEIRKNPV